MKVVFYPDTDSIKDILENFPEFAGAKFVAYGFAGVLQEPVTVGPNTQCWFISTHSDGQYEKASFTQLRKGL